MGRGTEQDDDIRKRIELAKEELTYQNAYDYRVVNDNLADCVNEVCDIIKGVK
jgi:guanylate kinase